MRSKNDYSISFFNGDKRVLFLKYVHRIEEAIKWVDSKGIEWDHCNIYERRTENFIRQIKKNK